MALSTLRIISRESPLARWQAEYVRNQLCALHPDVRVEIIGVTTQADKFLDRSLASMGGKGMFVKELEQALLDGRADLAVHSMKDVTVDLPEKLVLPVILRREDPRDVFISKKHSGLNEVPPGTRIGTSSLRRRCQLMAIRPDLQILDIRGNIGTRLTRLEEANCDALILAAAGLKRLGLEECICSYFPQDVLLPAIGQGALGVEMRACDEEVLELLAPLNDEQTNTCVNAERAFNKRINGGCHAPVAAYAEIKENTLTMSALVGRLDGSKILQSTISGTKSDAQELGDALGGELLDMGAGDILAMVTNAGKV